MKPVTDATANSEGNTQTDDVSQRLLEAAVESIAEHGFETAKVADIASRAGLTTGAIYSRWSGKHALINDAVRYIAHRCIDVEAVECSDQSSDHDSEAGGAPDIDGAFVIHKMIESSADFMSPENATARDVMLEALVSARRDARFRETLADSLNEQAATLGELLTKGKDAGVVKPHLSTTAMVALYQALSVGIHLVMSSQSAESRVSAEEWRELMKHVAESLSTQS